MQTFSRECEHLKVLIEAEEKTGHIQFRRTSDGIEVSCQGYDNKDLHELEVKLLGLGCRYNFSKGIRQYNNELGRTYSYFFEPKESL